MKPMHRNDRLLLITLFFLLALATSSNLLGRYVGSVALVLLWAIAVIVWLWRWGIAPKE